MALGRKFNQKSENKESGDIFQSKVEPEPGSVEDIAEVLRESYEQRGVTTEIKNAQGVIDSVDKKTKKKVQVVKAAAPLANDQEVYEIKNVLGEDLGPSYYKMTPEQQQKFLAEEEKVAVEIKGALSQGHIKAKKIFSLIFKWIKTIPLVNSFFAKQEAKIKTDKIMDLKNKK